MEKKSQKCESKNKKKDFMKKMKSIKLCIKNMVTNNLTKNNL